MQESVNPHTPYWFTAIPGKRFSRLNQDLQTDVLVIGAGITGLTTAYLLKSAGRRVTVVDQSFGGSGETGKTTAHLTEIVDSRYTNLINKFGVEGAIQVAQASRAAIEKIYEISNRIGADVDFLRLPAYLFSDQKKDKPFLEKELKASQRCGINSFWAEAVPFPSARNKWAIQFENQAQFHPGKYIQALAQAIVGKDCRIYENMRVLEIQNGTPCRVVTENYTIFAKEVIVAAHSPILNRVFLQTKVAAYRTYAMAVQVRNPPVRPGLFWDTTDPYHYIRRLSNDSDTWIIGGEDHKVGFETDTEQSFQRLVDFIDSRFGLERCEAKWSGQILEPVDGLPLIGKNSFSKHLYVATGFTGNGMTFGTVSGMLISDQILGIPNPWTQIFDPTRIKPLASAKAFISENVDFPICLVKDRLRKPSCHSIEKLEKNHGEVIQHEGKRIAVYKNAQGEVQACSAVCPHLGCYVHWNSAEKSWDCPCHGSRFDISGAVLNGPATQPLEQVVLPKASQKEAA